MPRIVKDNAHGAGGRCKPSEDNNRLKRASEFDGRVLHTPHPLTWSCFLPTSSVRFETGQIAQHSRKKKEIHTTPPSPKAWKDPSFPHRARAGWACYTAGRRTHASHVNGAPTHTHTYETHMHAHTHAHNQNCIHVATPPHPSGSRAQMHISEPHPTGSPRSARHLPHQGRPEGGPRFANDRPAGAQLLLSDRSRTRRERAGKSKNTTTTTSGKRQGPQKTVPLYAPKVGRLYDQRIIG